MSAEQTKDGFAFTCDNCGAEWAPPKFGRGSDSLDFRESLDLAKQAGWRAVKVKSRSGKEDWQHRCGDCR